MFNLLFAWALTVICFAFFQSAFGSHSWFLVFRSSLNAKHRHDDWGSKNRFISAMADQTLILGPRIDSEAVHVSSLEKALNR